MIEVAVGEGGCGGEGEAEGDQNQKASVGDEVALFEPGPDEAGLSWAVRLYGIGRLELEWNGFRRVGKVKNEGGAGEDAAGRNNVMGGGGTEDVGALDGGQPVCFALWSDVELKDFDFFDFGDAAGIEYFRAVAEGCEVDV